MTKTRWIAAAAAALWVSSSCARMPAPSAAPKLIPPDAGWVGRTLKKMTVEEKIGQMIAVRFTGTFRNGDSEYLKNLESLVTKHKIGGLILFGGEVYETAELANSFQRLAKIPLLLASDFERGAGNQITNATLFPPLMSLGAAGSEEMAYEMGRITALEGRAMGIHMTYAPVVDVNINPANPIINTRSVGEDPAMVGRMARAFIRGCQGNGMIATAKHFPGHGDTDQDSHLLLPTISAGLDRLEKVELAPFKEAVDAGVRAVMTSHLFVPALEPTPNLPATLSPAILTDLLRKKLGFKGLIVTDAMEMAGVTNAYSPEEAALRAILAGVDMVLLPPEPARVAEFLAAAALEGKIPAGRIDESVRRILEAKAGLGLNRERFVRIDELRRRIAPRAFLDQAYKTFEAAVTLVRNEGNAIPLAGPERKIAVLSLSSDQGDYFAGRAFAAEMKKRNPGIQSFFADGDTGQEELDSDAALCAGADVVVVALFSRLTSSKGSVDLEPKHAALVEKLAAMDPGPAVVAVSFGSPYFLQHFPEVDGYVCVYRNAPETQSIAAAALFGEIDIGGRLPVSLPGLYPIGHGIQLKKIVTTEVR
jgi:beta-N-acetylhexosaminidase